MSDSAITLSTLCHQMAMTVGNYIVQTPTLGTEDRKSLLDYQSKLQDLASDFIDADIDDTLDEAEVSLGDIQKAISDANTTAAKIKQTSDILTLAAATASLGFAIFTGVTTGGVGAIPGALSDLVNAIKPLMAV